MRRLTAIAGTFVVLAAGLTLSGLSTGQATAPTPGAAASAKPAVKPPAKTRVTVRGEILDLSCYLARGLAGPMHRDCALRCISVGVPMGILSEDSTLYLLTQEHARAMAPSSFTNPDAFAACKQWPALAVEISGMAFIRNGVHILEVSKAVLLPATAPAASK